MKIKNIQVGTMKQFAIASAILDTEQGKVTINIEKRHDDMIQH